MSVGDAGRVHELIIRAARRLDLSVRVVGGYKETRPSAFRAARAECLAAPSLCAWDEREWSRSQLLDELERPDLCAVAVPLVAPMPIKLGVGITTIIEVVARGVPLITLGYPHMARYLLSECNAYLVSLPDATPLPQQLGWLAARYQEGLVELTAPGKRQLFQECAERHAANFTREAVGRSMGAALEHG